jgi:hypothetical protein
MTIYHYQALIMLHSGYWFLDQPDTKWTPPQTLLEFLSGRSRPIAYIGFGSITDSDPGIPAKTSTLAKNSNYCVISQDCWGNREAGEQGRRKGSVFTWLVRRHLSWNMEF